jgi:hypothetical protein
MRNIGALVVVGLLLLGALVAFLLWGPLGERPGMREVAEETVSQQAAPRGGRSETASRAVETGGTESAERTGLAGQRDAVTGMTGAQAVPGAPSRTGLSFPTSTDIPEGMERARLVASFGKPNMITTVVDRGLLIETYVYLRRDPNTATVVMLRGGRVVGSNTTVY